MHIDLSNENKNKYLPAGEKLGLSVSDICNRILAAVDTIDITMLVKLSPKQDSELEKVKPRARYSTRPKWSVRLR